MKPPFHCLTLPTPYPVGDVNVYLFPARRADEFLTLFDTGPSWPPARDHLLTGLADLGFAVSQLGQIILSHPHPDHVGLAAELAAVSGARVLAHAQSAPRLSADPTGARREFDFFSVWAEQNGVPTEVWQQFLLAQAESLEHQEPVTPTTLLGDGDRLSLAGADWLVLSTPGHSGGLICLFQQESRVLVASDHLIRHISSNPILEPPGPEDSERPKRLLQYLEQLQRVASLEPTVAFTGHGAPVREVARLVQDRLSFHHDRAERIRNELADGPLTVYRLARRLFPGASSPVPLFLALSEVQGHLDLLQKERRADVNGSSPRLWYRL
jgi:glyoxylase-like metal-dependent hydrolase (beta-lactamase superfamily II)